MLAHTVNEEDDDLVYDCSDRQEAYQQEMQLTAKGFGPSGEETSIHSLINLTQ